MRIVREGLVEVPARGLATGLEYLESAGKQFGSSRTSLDLRQGGNKQSARQDQNCFLHGLERGAHFLLQILGSAFRPLRKFDDPPNKTGRFGWRRSESERKMKLRKVGWKTIAGARS